MQKKIILIAGALSLVSVASACAPAGTGSNKKGLEAYEDGDYQNAVYLFKQAITQEPLEADYYCNLGQAYCALGDYDEAVESFTRAIELEDGLFSAYRGLGMAYDGMGEYELAEENFALAIETSEQLDDSYRLDVLGYRAKTRTASGDYEGALEDYQELIDAGYRERDIYQLMGDVCLLMEDVDRTLRYYQKCLDIDNRNYEGYLLMAEKLEEAEAYEARQVVLNAALQVTPYEPEDWCSRGRIFLELDMVDEAFSAFEESYNKGCFEAGYYLGYCYELKGEGDEAIHLFEEQLSRYPSDADLYNQLASAMIREGDYEDALVILEKGESLASGSQLADLMWNECICYEKMGDYDTAIQKFMSYLEAYPADEEAQRELAFLYSR